MKKADIMTPTMAGLKKESALDKLIEELSDLGFGDLVIDGKNPHPVEIRLGCLHKKLADGKDAFHPDYDGLLQRLMSNPNPALAVVGTVR